MELGRAMQRVQADESLPAEKKAADLARMQSEFEAFTKQIAATTK
jgi:hypothetical protein